jgi:hypothetical protein
MKYMLMMAATQAGWESFGKMAPDDIRAHILFMKQLNKELAASGELVSAEGLTPPQAAKVLQLGRDGSPAVTDGPFPESKEFLAGYWILDCASEARVLEIAARISGAPGRDGTPVNIPVEIRPVGEAPQL